MKTLREKHSQTENLSVYMIGKICQSHMATEKSDSKMPSHETNCNEFFRIYDEPMVRSPCLLRLTSISAGLILKTKVEGNMLENQSGQRFPGL